MTKYCRREMSENMHGPEGFKPKDCPDCYLKGWARHRYSFDTCTKNDPDAENSEAVGPYARLMGLMRKADFCQTAKEEVDRAFQCLHKLPTDLREASHLDYLEIECPNRCGDPQVTVRVALPYYQPRGMKTIFTEADELEQAVDHAIRIWLEEGMKY